MLLRQLKLNIVRPLPLFARIRGGSRTVAPGDALVLDASESFDGNVAPENRSEDSGLQYGDVLCRQWFSALRRFVQLA